MHDITGPFIRCSIVCATSEPFISFTYFSQIHPYEYVKGKLCGMLFPLEKTGCGLIKINPFDLHLVFKQYKVILSGVGVEIHTVFRRSSWGGEGVGRGVRRNEKREK